MYNHSFNQKGNSMTNTNRKDVDLNNMDVQEALLVLENIRQHPETRLSAHGHKAFEMALENVTEFVEAGKSDDPLIVT